MRVQYILGGRKVQKQAEKWGGREGGKRRGGKKEGEVIGGMEGGRGGGDAAHSDLKVDGPVRGGEVLERRHEVARQEQGGH